MLSFVVAMSLNNVIGRNNNLPWHLPNDLKRFKEITCSKSRTMIMGRRTFEALPGILPGRKHIILTRNKCYEIDDDNVYVIHDIDELNPYIIDEEEFFVIGGGDIFTTLMPYAKKMYITLIHDFFEGDTYFPKYNRNEWDIIEKQEGIMDERNVYKHTFLTLSRL